jgi:acetyl-CoA synthetase
MLACARIGAIHSVFCWICLSGATRINDSDCKMVITSDGGYRGKNNRIKKIIDEALKMSISKFCFGCKRTNLQ